MPALATRFLHPGITTLFALKVSLPATLDVALRLLACRKTKVPEASVMVAEVDPESKVMVVCVESTWL